EEVAVTDATGTMDDYLFMVNGVYVIPEKVADPGPFKVGSHNTVVSRTRHENFIDNVNTGDAFGGLQNGFYRFTNEPRSGITFSQGGSIYNSNGYFALTLYNGELEIKNSTESSYLTKYNVEKNIVTAEFDAYFPECPSGSFYLNIALYDDGTRKSQEKILIFNSSNMASTGNDNIVDVTGNSWNRIAIAFDMTDTPTSGKIAIKAYVNGKWQKTFYSDNGDYRNEAAVQFAPLAYLRLFAPKYVSYGTLGSGKWYVGDYTPSVPAVSEHKITPSNEVFVSESDLLIASNLSEDKLIELMKDYIPVYKITYDIDAINDKYTAVDGTVTELEDQNRPTGAHKAYQGKVIKRWIEASPHFTVTDGEGGKKVYNLKDTKGERAYIISAVDNGGGIATIAFNKNEKGSSFTDSTTYSGVCTGLPDIIAQTENAVKKELVGFATVEAGKFPKVYTLTESGLNLRDLTFNKDTNKAELSYRKFGNVANAVSFQLVVAAYDKDGKLLELKSDKPQTINSSTTDGERIIDFAPEFSAATLDETHHYKVFMFDSLVKCIPLFKSAEITK
ncbi:MAG: hypothetical protein II244_05685, partial [Clostridia bacterium]|nr:hypothetical protein [Clostridia bacterium]